MSTKTNTSWTRPLTWLRRLPGALVIALAIGVGFLVRLGLEPAVPRQPDGVAHDQAAEEATAGESEAETYWTCSMHPQIKYREFGLCPICNMDLVEVAASPGGALRRIGLTPAARALLQLATSPVERRFVTARVRLTGKLDFDETRVSDLTAWVPGRLERLYVDYTGVRVEEGEHMFELFSPGLIEAHATLIYARKKLAELPPEPLTAQRESAQRTLDASREGLRLMGLKAEQIAWLEEQEDTVETVTVPAPAGGIVIEKMADRGQYVETGTRIYRIADLSQLWLRLEAHESDLPWLRYGQVVHFTVRAHPGELFSGEIAFIDPVLDHRMRAVSVRVNVPNADGRLKPGMFANAVVETQVASAGRVVEPALAGKWICPMHPDEIADGPADCGLCGMALKTTEELGLVPLDAETLEVPLVIPVSAALVTGTRAVVYLELEEDGELFYEGREVLLGPRAGEHFLVRAGLEEGQRVVTRGNFKLDSALQIQARPSMMTPLGTDGVPIEEELPDAFGFRLEAVERAALRARSATELEAARAAWAALGEALGQVQAELLTGEPRALWDEAAMRLANDSVEGAEAIDLKTARRVAAGNAATLEWLRSELGTPPPELPAGAVPELPEALSGTLAQFWGDYLELHAALAGDDPVAAAAAVEAAGARLPVDPHGLEGEALRALQVRADELAASLLVLRAAGEDIEQQRVAFEPFAAEVEKLVTIFGTGTGVTPVKHYCPMAFQRGAAWLQADEETLNPYYGAMMLRCGSPVGLVEARGLEVDDGQ